MPCTDQGVAVIKFWETKPKERGGVTLASVSFDSVDEALEYAHGISPSFHPVQSRGTYVVAAATNSAHTLEIGRKDDETASQIMNRLMLSSR
jgi:hypothetical protein